MIDGTNDRAWSQRLIRASAVGAFGAAYVAFVLWILDWGWPPWAIAAAIAIALGLFAVEFLSRTIDREPLVRRLTPFLLIVGAIGSYAALSAVFGFAFDKAGALVVTLAARFIWDLFFSRKRHRAYATSATRDQVLRFVPPAGRALVIVIRAGKVAADVPLQITVGNQAFAPLFGPGFAALSVDPEATMLRAGFRQSSLSSDGPSNVAIDPSADEVLVFRAVITMDLARVYLRLEPVNDLAEAREALVDLKLAA